MKAFVELFRDIVLWRKGPQDLPASVLLLWLAAIAYVSISAVQLAVLGETGLAWVLFLAIDPALLTLCTWLVLRLFGHPERFVQTATAVLGCGAWLSAVLYLPLQVAMTLLHAGPDSTLSRLVALVLLGTFVAVTGRILQLGTGTNLFTGVAFALTYFVLLNSLLGALPGGVS